MRLTSTKGFTLLELLVVVALLGIIVAIAVPQYSAYRTRAEYAQVTSNCRSLYRAFTIFYLEPENGFMYPSNPDDGNEDDLDLATFYPLVDPGMMGGVKFEIDINQLIKNVGGNPANRIYVADDDYQKYYLVMPWGKDPSTRFIVASSDGVLDNEGLPVDGGKWLDGVFMWKNGQLKYQ